MHVITSKRHIPADLVVDRWTSASERGLHRHFLFRQDVWTMFRGQISKEIISTISMPCCFTTKSRGIWHGTHAGKVQICNTTVSSSQIAREGMTSNGTSALSI
jgi:hypothetical protein